jgi:hypothetical protein
MLQSISSPRGEAASSPSPRCRYSQNALTLGILQLHFGTCSYNRTLDVTRGLQQSQAGPKEARSCTSHLQDAVHPPISGTSTDLWYIHRLYSPTVSGTVSGLQRAGLQQVTVQVREPVLSDILRVGAATHTLTCTLRVHRFQVHPRICGTSINMSLGCCPSGTIIAR